jgi:outer membrane protein assembly factor BamB
VSSPRPHWRITVDTPSTPRMAVAGDAVVVPSFGPGRSDMLACYALDDGALRWQVPLDDFMLADAVSGVELVADADGDAVYLAQGIKVAAFAVATGALRWVVKVPPTEPFESFTLAGPPVVAGKRLLLRSRRSRLVAVERKDGALAWATDDREAASDVLVAGDVAVTRTMGAPELRAYARADGSLRWRRPGGAPVALVRGPGTDDDAPYLLVDGRFAMALDPASGDVRWQVPVDGPARAAVLGDVVVLADDGSVRGLDAGSGASRWLLDGRGPALVAPLDGVTALVVRASASSVVDVGSGKARDHAGHRVHEQDRVLDARFGAVALTVDNGIGRLGSLDSGGGLRDQLIAATTAKPGDPAPHGVLEAIVVAGGAVTLDTAHELCRYVA